MVSRSHSTTHRSRGVGQTPLLIAIAIIIGLLLLIFWFWPPGPSGPVVQVDCSKQTLTGALQQAKPGTEIRVTGECKQEPGTVLINKNGITIDGGGTAVLDGGGSNPVITVSGAQDVVLKGFTVTNGRDGIVITNAAHVVLDGIKAIKNQENGLKVSGKGSVARIARADAPQISHKKHQTPRQTPAQTSQSGTGLDWSPSLLRSHWGWDAAAQPACIFDAHDNQGNGLFLELGGSVFLENCTAVLSNNVKSGMLLTGTSSADIYGSSISLTNNQLHGIYVGDSSSVWLALASTLEAAQNGTGTQAGDGIRIGNISQITIEGRNTLKSTQNTRFGITVGEFPGDTSFLECIGIDPAVPDPEAIVNLALNTLGDRSGSGNVPDIRNCDTPPVP